MAQQQRAKTENPPQSAHEHRSLREAIPDAISKVRYGDDGHKFPQGQQRARETALEPYPTNVERREGKVRLPDGPVDSVQLE
jgi:hypothetical protein